MTAGPSGIAPVVEGPRTRLKLIEGSDIEFLYRLALDPARSYMWRFRGATPSPEQFHRELYNGVLAQFIVQHRERYDPLAHVVAYNASFENGTCYIGAVGSEGGQVGGLTIEGVAVFLSYVFASWPMRKVYAEVPAYSYGAFSSGAGRYFTEEGRLREASFHGDHYWDVHILATCRDDWLPVSQRLARLAEAQHG